MDHSGVDHDAYKISYHPNIQTANGRLSLQLIDFVTEGEELLINYLDRPVLLTLQQRQRKLEATYLFSCNCAICDSVAASSVSNNNNIDQPSSPGHLLEALRCPQSCSAMNGMLSPDEIQCVGCGVQIDPKWLSRSTRRVEEIDHQVCNQNAREHMSAIYF